MANALYQAGRQAFLRGEIAWHSDDIRCILVDANDYTVNLSSHTGLNSIPGAARVATSGAMTTNTSVGDGIADASDVVFTAVTGDVAEALVLYKHTGTEATSTLIAYIDTATNLPATPNGGNITVSWANSGNYIFKL